MTFRWRLVLALALTVVFLLIPLLFAVRYVIQVSVDTYTPEQTDQALQQSVELARDHIVELRRSLDPKLLLAMEAFPPPSLRPQARPHIAFPVGERLFMNQDTTWYQWSGGIWIETQPPPPADSVGFGKIPERLEVRKTDDEGRTWLIVHELDPDFRNDAILLQKANAEWIVAHDQISRLVNTLTFGFGIAYIIVALIGTVVGFWVLSPLTRRIERLTDVAESIRTGNEEIRADVSNDEVGRLALTFNLMLDRLIASRRHAAEMEKRAAWRELAPVLAHEIKNPLTPIQLSVQQADESYHGDDERFARTLHTAREIVDEEVERLRKLVRDFGDFARAPVPEPEEVNLIEFAADLAQLYGDRIEVKLHVARHGEKELQTADFTQPVSAKGMEAFIVMFDNEKIRRAMVNLLDNAIAAADGKPARMSIDLLEDELKIVIEDSGPGVPEDQRETIFEPYFTTKSNGIGLGLPVVRSTVEQHGGQVWVEQSEELRGARFVVELPVE